MQDASGKLLVARGCLMHGMAASLHATCNMKDGCCLACGVPVAGNTAIQSFSWASFWSKSWPGAPLEPPPLSTGSPFFWSVASFFCTQASDFFNQQLLTQPLALLQLLQPSGAKRSLADHGSSSPVFRVAATSLFLVTTRSCLGWAAMASVASPLPLILPLPLVSERHSPDIF